MINYPGRICYADSLRSASPRVNAAYGPGCKPITAKAFGVLPGFTS